MLGRRWEGPRWKELGRKMVRVFAGGFFCWKMGGMEEAVNVVGDGRKVPRR